MRKMKKGRKKSSKDALLAYFGFPLCVMLGRDLYRQSQARLAISRLTQQDLVKRVGVVIHVGARGLDARHCDTSRVCARSVSILRA
jgi:hypothetical protein